MTIKTGWWTLEVTGVDELDDADREHIGELIKDGFTSGQVVQETEELEATS